MVHIVFFNQFLTCAPHELYAPEAMAQPTPNSGDTAAKKCFVISGSVQE